jgi:hypothetical protein
MGNGISNSTQCNTITLKHRAKVQECRAPASFLSSSYIRLFCNKFVVYFVRRFLQQFYKCRRISEPGCQQLLLDLQHLRKRLHDLPNEGVRHAALPIKNMPTSPT